MTSDYLKVCEFNKAFDFPQYDDFSNKSCLKLRLDLIKEEIGELEEAINNNDIIEQQDACADILYVAYGMAYTYKIDSDKILEKYMLDKSKTLFQNIDKYFESVLDEFTNHSVFTTIKVLFTNLENLCNDNSGSALEDWINILHYIIVKIYIFQIICNYNSDKIFTIVHDSNMSKLCKNEEEAKQTVIKYEQEYKDGKSPYDSPYYYPLDNGLYVIKNKSTGKALKSINYVKVKLN
jgi:predicted HAD superfamily Cof-like phosphohydrolase